MHPGDHYCGMFRSDADQRHIVVDFVRLGVAGRLEIPLRLAAIRKKQTARSL